MSIFRLRAIRCHRPLPNQGPSPDYTMRFTPLLTQLLNRVARDHASPGGLVLDPTRHPLAHAR